MTKHASHGEIAGAPAAPATQSASALSRSVGLLAHLGLHGLSHLDAPVLAALATETPMLLIGPTAVQKSTLIERLALVLGLEHRHHNASLISFDDLVGFPVPKGDGLCYLRTLATLWGAQSIFLDEISRCRPELQNKLFSITHEKRVQGAAWKVCGTAGRQWIQRRRRRQMTSPTTMQAYSRSTPHWRIGPALCAESAGAQRAISHCAPFVHLGTFSYGEDDIPENGVVEPETTFMKKGDELSCQYLFNTWTQKHMSRPDCGLQASNCTD